jgi:hypothetical protein
MFRQIFCLFGDHEAVCRYQGGDIFSSGMLAIGMSSTSSRPEEWSGWSL